MEAITESLRDHISRRVILTFFDGEIVDAVLLAVDPDEHDDITFEVIEVHKASAGRSPVYDARNVYVSPIDAVISVRAAA